MEAVLGHGDLGSIEDAGLVHVVPGEGVQGGSLRRRRPVVEEIVGVVGASHADRKIRWSQLCNILIVNKFSSSSPRSRKDHRSFEISYLPHIYQGHRYLLGSLWWSGWSHQGRQRTQASTNHHILLPLNMWSV